MCLMKGSANTNIVEHVEFKNKNDQNTHPKRLIVAYEIRNTIIINLFPSSLLFRASIDFVMDI